MRLLTPPAATGADDDQIHVARPREAEDRFDWIAFEHLEVDVNVVAGRVELGVGDHPTGMTRLCCERVLVVRRSEERAARWSRQLRVRSGAPLRSSGGA